MAALGTTLSPGGESGNVQGLDMQLDASPNNPMSIKQDTSIETLTHVLEKDWIWKETVTVSTTMAPGTVFAIFPIHPYECNRFVKHVGSMFNCWTGSMMLRMRMMATAFYGGSIRVGYLPPNMTKNEIRNMPLDVLTVFPNDDFDPKNTTWTHFNTPDERDVAYHYMSNNPEGWDENDKRSFGGYIVLYVAGRLVTQSPEFNSINIIIESAGNFKFSQINPKFGTTITPTTDGTLYGDALIPSRWIPVDCPRSPAASKIVILPNSQPLGVGGFRMEPLGYSKLTDAADIHIDPAMYPFTTLTRESGVFDIYNSGSSISLPSIPDDYVYALPGAVDLRYVPRNMNQFGFPDASPGIWAVDDWDAAFQRRISCDNLANNIDNSTGLTQYRTNTAAPDAGVSYTQTTEWFLDSSDLNAAAIGAAMHGATYTHSTFKPNANESIIVFYNSVARFPSLQSTVAADILKATDNHDSVTSEIYALRRGNGTIITYIRLNPNGIMTVPLSSTENVLDITQDLRLEFVQYLPITSPLPVSNNLRKHIKKQNITKVLQNSPEKLGISRAIADIMLS